MLVVTGFVLTEVLNVLLQATAHAFVCLGSIGSVTIVAAAVKFVG